MNLFITGATGFIGVNLVNFFLEKDINITINIREKGLNNYPKNVRLYTLQESSIEEDIIFFKKSSFDGIIHLASLYLKSHNSFQIKDLVDSNIGFSTHLLECAVKAKVGWFINTGSFFQNKNNNDYSPVNLYSATKEAFSNIAKYYIENNLINFYTIKLSDTYGLNDQRPKIINLLIDSILQNTQMCLEGNPNQTFNVVHVKDVVNCFYLLSKLINNNNNKIINGTVFCADSSIKYSLKEITEIINSSSNNKLKISWNNSSNIIFKASPNNKIKVPHWKQKISLNQGIKDIFNNLNL
jgi:CDP-paratose synthetase